MKRLLKWCVQPLSQVFLIPGKDDHERKEESLLGEGKYFGAFIESFPTSSLCKKGVKILVPKISASFVQKNSHSLIDFCQELFENIPKGFHVSVSRCFSCSECSVYEYIYSFFSSQMLSKCLPHFFLWTFYSV